VGLPNFSVARRGLACLSFRNTPAVHRLRSAFRDTWPQRPWRKHPCGPLPDPSLAQFCLRIRFLYFLARVFELIFFILTLLHAFAYCALNTSPVVMNGFGLDEDAFGEKAGIRTGLRTFDAFRECYDPRRLRSLSITLLSFALRGHCHSPRTYTHPYRTYYYRHLKSMLTGMLLLQQRQSPRTPLLPVAVDNGRSSSS